MLKKAWRALLTEPRITLEHGAVHEPLDTIFYPLPPLGFPHL